MTKRTQRTQTTTKRDPLDSLRCVVRDYAAQGYDMTKYRLGLAESYRLPIGVVDEEIAKVRPATLRPGEIPELPRGYREDPNEGEEE